ncbi:hypothetical protein, partial [Burkholderia territorii]
ADDSADSRVKVGNRQAPLKPETPAQKAGVFAFVAGFAAGDPEPNGLPIGVIGQSIVVVTVVDDRPLDCAAIADR